jgi:hypothetical protein
MPRVGLAFVAAALALTPLPAPADPDLTIATDRPAVTESSVVVPEGALQFESGLLATNAAGVRVLDAPELDWRYGLLARTELRLAAPDYFRAVPPAAAASGFGDLAVGIKQQLGPLAGFDLSLVSSASLPTGARGIGSGAYDPSLQLPWSHALPGNWTLAGQLASYWLTQAGRHVYTGEGTILLDRQLSAPWDAFIEYAGDFPRQGGASQLLHAGTAY